MMSFEIDQSLLLQVKAFNKIHLSVSSYNSIEAKDLLSKGHAKYGRLEPKEHLSKLEKERRLINTEQPLLLISCRNVLANPRCIGYLNRSNSGKLISVEEEIFNADRPYFIFGESQNKLVLDELRIPDSHEVKAPYDWFISGVPVLWKGLNQNELFKNLVTEATDYSHVWKIPRGNHPEANDETRKNWDTLRHIFKKTIIRSREEAFLELVKYAEEHHLQREENYFHNLIGVNESGHLIQYAAKGKLEDLGKNMRHYGVEKAIMVDNSGSVATFFYPKGVNGPSKQLIGTPNYRPSGTAFLVIELENSSFG
ncbi:MAG: hypothetical protein IPN20_23745 [Haliscomenobacter sp.]|nr:hypothetical protein [Haliscomenobacter sp.]